MKRRGRTGRITPAAALFGAGLAIAAQTPEPLAPTDGPMRPTMARDAAQDGGAPAVGNEADEAESVRSAPLVEAWTGSLAEGIARVRERAEADEVDAARTLADRLLAPRGVARTRLAWREGGGAVVRAVLDATESWTEPLGWNGRPAVDRARVRIERALVSLAPEHRAAAEDDLGRALALAPAGPLREAAAYDLALLSLHAGEEWRARIPDLGGAPAPGGGAEEEAPDPLEEARQAYLEARERFVQRLRIDWRDADTRANVELVQRRLRELEEIERQREEQQEQEQQEQDQQQEGEDGEQRDEQSEEQQDSQEQERQDESQPDEEGEDGEQQDSESQQESEQERREQQEEQEQQPQEGEETERRPEEGEPQEVHLSREELQRLLNRLAEHEREAEALRERRRQRGSRGVDQDW